ncbi:DUF72 domain-containing protein [Paenibacillus gansuensis]|uniref:DUF72 domain-containing protein n=1 Tax=Paenibacillus gansuensis TaxID=306542 RepID=A0ABW5PDS9_9BACL
MISIGLAGWGDHPELYPSGVAARNKLHVYSSHFRVVEIDSTFYAIPRMATADKWANVTPDGFGFVVKAYQGMTGHMRGPIPYPDRRSMFDEFTSAMNPLLAAGKLKAVLFQYPPWFQCSKENVALLREHQELMGEGWPLALEFRHQSWFRPDIREKTLRFMEQEGWIHAVCDEPQAGSGSVPAVPVATHPELTIVRFHGRNEAGWNQDGNPNWREIRYLYKYTEDELSGWVPLVKKLNGQSKEVILLFNNNSGGDAASNAKQMIRILGLPEQGLAPKQLELFD